jgi:mono/diheme cytochrome c family protein
MTGSKNEQRAAWLGIPALALIAVLISPVQAIGQAGVQGEVTFAGDVLTILQENCQTCHRPGNVAPMSLLTYEEARPWASVIADKVASREMPPWPLDVTVGIQEFKNDRSLSVEEIETLVAWAEQGAPLGDVAEMPPAIDWPEWTDTWQFAENYGRPPDLILPSPKFLVPAQGLDQWPELVSYVEGLDSPRWIQAVEIRPGTPESRYVYHHANPDMELPSDGEWSTDMEGGGQLVEGAAGGEGFIFPENTGRLIVPGSRITWPMHYFPSGEEIEAFLEVGLWFFPEGVTPRFETAGEQHLDASQGTAWGASEIRVQGRNVREYPQMRGSQPDILIPPNSLAMNRGTVVTDRPMRLHSIRGHMHLRGKHQIVEVVYPDGRWEILNKLDWNHAWATSFLYEDNAMPLIPKGSVLIVTSVFDNTTANPHNPDPNQWVTRGDRSVDEMGHVRFGVTYLTQEEFDELVEERERALENMVSSR